ncbi:MAG TPA: hypothetical protein VGR96_19635 [Acidobacteriaceae bacterium]|nr:hypothetical protein [Acidobacteriaceae bacterium]
MKGIGVAQWKWGSAAVLLVWGCFLGSMARAQAGPPSPTVQEAPELENQTLLGVKYNNKYEMYGGPAYSHFNGGPSLVDGTNLGGFDIQGTRWFTPRLGATVNLRGYYGTQAVVPNHYGISGPFIFEHMGLGGLSIRGPKNQHAALNFHALVGASYGIFSTALNPGLVPPQLGMFNNSFALATAMGGSLDLNRSPKIALRLSPDYLFTNFGGGQQHEVAFSVGILYRFSRGTPGRQPARAGKRK